MQNVIQKYYFGFIKDDELLTAINCAIKEWNREEPLYIFLGMCFPEYLLWKTNPNKFLEQMHNQSYYPRFWNITD
jgi:hypothetical protein